MLGDRTFACYRPTAFILSIRIVRELGTSSICVRSPRKYVGRTTFTLPQTARCYKKAINVYFYLLSFLLQAGGVTPLSPLPEVDKLRNKTL